MEVGEQQSKMLDFNSKLIKQYYVLSNLFIKIINIDKEIKYWKKYRVEFSFCVTLIESKLNIMKLMNDLMKIRNL